MQAECGFWRVTHEGPFTFFFKTLGEGESVIGAFILYAPSFIVFSFFLFSLIFIHSFLQARRVKIFYFIPPLFEFCSLGKIFKKEKEKVPEEKERRFVFCACLVKDFPALPM